MGRKEFTGEDGNFYVTLRSSADWAFETLIFRITTPPRLPLNTRVCDLINDSGHWDRELVNASFWKHEADAVLSIPMGYVLRNEDMLVWHYEKTSCYTIRSRYWLACAIRDC
ncbi:hypothetical protein CerSpe_241720 [Prunus speciosa]